MTRIYEFANRKRRLIIAIACGAAIVLAAILIFSRLSDLSSLGGEVIGFIAPTAGTLLFSLIIPKIVPNKRYIAGCFILFTAVFILFTVLNTVTLHFSGALVGAPLCSAITLITAGKMGSGGTP